MAGYVTSASILRISDEKTMQLLELYCQQECLWDTNHEYYKDQMHRRHAAEKIAASLDIPNFGPRHVTTKFKNLRNAYSQELKKIAANKMAGVDYKPSVFWFNKMDSFIKPHLQKPRGRAAAAAAAAALSSLICHVDGDEHWLRPHGNSPYLFTTEIEDTSENDSSDSTRKRKSENTPNTQNKIHRLDSDSDEPKFVEISIPKVSSEIETNKNGDTFKVDQLVKDYIDDQQRKVVKSFEDLTTSLRALASRDDDVFDCFGKYVAGLLRSLPQKKALAVQPHIIDLITAAGLDDDTNTEEEHDYDSVVVKIEKC